MGKGQDSKKEVKKPKKKKARYYLTKPGTILRIASANGFQDAPCARAAPYPEMLDISLLPAHTRVIRSPLLRQTAAREQMNEVGTARLQPGVYTRFRPYSDGHTLHRPQPMITRADPLCIEKDAVSL